MQDQRGQVICAHAFERKGKGFMKHCISDESAVFIGEV